MNLGHILFSFSGRINRAKWWLTALITVIVQVLMWGLTQAGLSEGLVSALSFAIGIVILWITLAAGAKRLHDLNKSGAWLVVFIGVPILLIIGFFAFAGLSVGATILAGQDLDPAELARIAGIGLIFGVLYMVLVVWALVWFGCLRGTVGANQYGADPLEGRV